MSYDEFNELVRSKLSEICGNEFSVTVYEAVKNNSVSHKGVSIKENTGSIAPTIYLEEFYTDYCDGRDIEDIVNEILRIYSENRLGPGIEAERFSDFEWVKDRVFFKVVNKERNTALLGQVPFSLTLDLAVICGVYMGNYKNSFSSVLIRNEHLKMWHTDESEIRKLAKVNTPHIMPYEVWSMHDLLKSMGMPQGECSPEVPMYVLTNKDRVNGAGVMLYDGLLRKEAENLGSDLYILPSSVHELIVVPKSEGMDPGELRAMISDVNDTQVEKEEILSYSLYEYSLDRDAISIAAPADTKKVASA